MIPSIHMKAKSHTAQVVSHVIVQEGDMLRKAALIVDDLVRGWLL